MLKILEKVFDQDKKYLKEYAKVVDQVMALEEEYSAMSDDELRGKTQEFKKRLEEGEDLFQIRPEAYATVREASKRAVGLFPFEVQVLGAVALSDGNVSEMKTGEGKTLTAAMPSYLFALHGKGMHVVTVNEYLAERDSQDIGRIHAFLGLTVGLIKNDMSFEMKKEAYEADITYVTNSELGFDYLRDNMAMTKEQRVIRGLNYALVDEVDSILIDEARTPLIISGQPRDAHKLYHRVDSVVKGLKKDDDFTVSLKDKVAHLNEEGITKIERMLSISNLYDVENSQITHAINQSLKANYCMEKDVDYVVQGGAVLIVDQFTGRTMDGRVFSDGLHQAIEAKEGVATQKETKTLATITYQNFFRLYEVLSGMTGTAKTEEEEIQKIYNMDVIVIPTNKPVLRKDRDDLIFKNNKAKYHHMVELIKERHEVGQPILLGTVAIETSEEISKILKNVGLKHNVLNAKHHMQEAQIIEFAGEKGAITIATNMAGRGTDIKLSEEVKALESFTSELFEEEVTPSGLLVIGTERHDSRRIDNQLRGRSGRQGDNGESVFYVSFEDSLSKRYLPDNFRKILQSIGDENEVLASKRITAQIQKLQKRVESINFDIRDNVLKYDDVLREQRELMYGQRDDILFNDNSLEQVKTIIENYLIEEITPLHEQGRDDEIEELIKATITDFNFTIDLTQDPIAQVKEIADREIDKKIEEHGEGIVGQFAKVVMIKVIDSGWVNHIDDMQVLRQAIGLRGYGQIDPLQEYQKEGRRMFDELMYSIERDIVKIMLKGSIRSEQDAEQKMKNLEAEHNKDTGGPKVVKEPVVKDIKIGRNDPCYCGSGEKYKNCHGK